MSKEQPLVSIIIPTFNRAHLIGETLDSVLAQTYQNWECIVVDDGSTDNTDEVVGAYVKKDPRFQYHKRPNTHKPGGNGARNYGFELSQGEYVQWFDDDDLMDDDKIEKQLLILRDINYAVSFCSWGKFINDKSDVKINPKPYFKNYESAFKLFQDIGTYGGYLPCHSYLIRREILNKSGLWNEDLIVNQDGEFFVRVLINAQKIKFASNTHVFYRKSFQNNTSINDSIQKVEGRIKSWIKIEQHINSAYNVKKSMYVDKAKNSIYKLISKNYKHLKYKYFMFFK